MNESETRREKIDPLLTAAGWGVVEGRSDEPNAAGDEGWIGAAGEHGDGAARGEEACDEVAAEKTGAAGDESGRGVAHGRYGIHGTEKKSVESGAVGGEILLGEVRGAVRAGRRPCPTFSDRTRSPWRWRPTARV